MSRKDCEKDRSLLWRSSQSSVAKRRSQTIFNVVTLSTRISLFHHVVQKWSAPHQFYCQLLRVIYSGKRGKFMNAEHERARGELVLIFSGSILRDGRDLSEFTSQIFDRRKASEKYNMPAALNCCWRIVGRIYASSNMFILIIWRPMRSLRWVRSFEPSRKFVLYITLQCGIIRSPLIDFLNCLLLLQWQGIYTLVNI